MFKEPSPLLGTLQTSERAQLMSAFGDKVDIAKVYGPHA